jgi:hypothetical protein
MNATRIRDYISGIAVKRLSQVEISPSKSNQHELNGVAQIKKIFGLERRTFSTEFIYLPDDEENIVNSKGTATWYDARENHEKRSEYRLYYSGTEAIKLANSGDLISICLRNNGDLLVIITPIGSNSEGQVRWLFSLAEVGDQFLIKDFITEDNKLNFASRYVLDLIGINAFEEDTSFLGLLIDKFGYSFPSTLEFSAFARETCRDVSEIDEPDKALMLYLETEESLFRLMENQILKEEIGIYYNTQDGQVDVDGFISLSLSVINRRKSRAGFAFENHLEYIFEKNKILFSRGKFTERNNKPDFIFPGIKYYHKESFPNDLLSMLGVKSSAKDRWRQVLTEAERINTKHLITIQPAITQNQTDEMIANKLQLVVPAQIIESYNENQQKNILTLHEFIKHIMLNQKKTYSLM